MVAEGFVPTNNAIDPNETVTVLFALKNVGAANTTNLVVTLLPTNGVTAPSGPQTYGVLVAGGAAVSQPFTFTALGTCGGTISPDAATAGRRGQSRHRDGGPAPGPARHLVHPEL